MQAGNATFDVVPEGLDELKHDVDFGFLCGISILASVFFTKRIVE